MKFLSVFLSLTGICLAQAGFFDTFASFFTGGKSVPVPIQLSATAVAGLINDAKQLIMSQDFDKAVNVLLPLIDNDPDDKDANMLLGSSFLAMDRADLAETFLRHAVHLSQWMDAGSISNLAEATRLNGDLPQAANILQKGYVTMNNTDPSGQLSFEFGTLQEQMGNYTAAADWYLSSALADGSNTRAWLKASTLLFPNKFWNLALAENVLATAVKSKPDDAMLIFNLGVVMHYLDRINDAIILYKEALRLDPLQYATMSNLATALHANGQAGQAQELYQKVYNATLSSVSGEIFNPFTGTATALGNYALLLSSQKKFHQAAAVSTRACLLDPENVNLASVKETCAQQAAAAAVAVEQTRVSLVGAVTAGNWATGIDILSVSGPPAEDDAWWYFTKGMLHYFRGENELAFEYCSHARVSSAKHMTSTWLLGVASSSTTPTRVSHMISGCIGVSSQYLGRHAEAASHFGDALETLQLMSPSPSSPQVQIHILPMVGFSMNIQDVTFNLLLALKNAGNCEKCLAEGFKAMGVNPDLSEGSSLVLMFSFVDWKASPSLIEAIRSVEKREIASGRLNLPENTTLFDQIDRIQKNFMGLLTPMLECFEQLALGSKPVQTWRDHSSSLVMQSTAGLASTADIDTDKAASDDGNGLVLITQYFHSENVPARDALVEVLSKNLRNTDIAEVALVNEKEFNFSALQFSEKIKQYISGKRLTFADAFRVANKFYPGRTVVISNSDIFFDETLKLVKSPSSAASLDRTLMALSKWNTISDEAAHEEEEKISLFLRVDSQDAWVFTTPVPEAIIEQSEFFLGAPKCDNRIALLFADAGYRVINPTFALHAIEKRSEDVRSALLYGVENAVRGPTTYLLLSDASVL